MASTTSNNGYNGAWGADTLTDATANARSQIPDMPIIDDKKPPLTAMGATGTAILSGIIQSEEYNPDWFWRQGVLILEKMNRNDPQINATRNMIELPIRRAKWSIVPGSDSPEDQKIASFVETCLFHDMCSVTSRRRRSSPRKR